MTKIDLVASVRRGDIERVKKLTEYRSRIKKMPGECEVCAVTISKRAARCMTHRIDGRVKRRRIAFAAALLLCLTVFGSEKSLSIGAKLQAIKKTLPQPLVVTNKSPTPKMMIIPQVTVAWDTITDTNLLWYRLYYGLTSRGTNAAPWDWTYPAWVQTTNTVVTVANLVNGGTYYFSATCAVTLPNNNWLESDYSGEISYTLPYQALGLTVITVQPQMSMDQGYSFTPTGSPIVMTNPLAPTVLFKLSVTQTNF